MSAHEKELARYPRTPGVVTSDGVGSARPLGWIRATLARRSPSGSPSLRRQAALRVHSAHAAAVDCCSLPVVAAPAKNGKNRWSGVRTARSSGVRREMRTGVRCAPHTSVGVNARKHIDGRSRAGRGLDGQIAAVLAIHGHGQGRCRCGELVHLRQAPTGAAAGEAFSGCDRILHWRVAENGSPILPILLVPYPPLHMAKHAQARGAGAMRPSSGHGRPADVTSLTFTPPITYRKLFHPLNSNRYKTHMLLM